MTIEDERAFRLFHFIHDADAQLYKYTGRDYDKDGNVIYACDFYDIRIEAIELFRNSFIGSVAGRLQINKYGYAFYTDEQYKMSRETLFCLFRQKMFPLL